MVAGDAHLIDQLWLTAEYFPGIAFGARREVQPQAIAERLGGRTEIRPLRVPIDCADGFTEAFIARSVAYLYPEVRRNMSTFRLLPEDQAAAGVANLRRDPASGVWDARYGHLRRLPHLDTGLRIVVSDPGAMLRRRALGQDDGAIGARTAPPTCHQRRTRPTLDRVAGERGCLGGRRC